MLDEFWPTFFTNCLNSLIFDGTHPCHISMGLSFGLWQGHLKTFIQFCSSSSVNVLVYFGSLSCCMAQLLQLKRISPFSVSSWSHGPVDDCKVTGFSACKTSRNFHPSAKMLVGWCEVIVLIVYSFAKHAVLHVDQTSPKSWFPKD